MINGDTGLIGAGLPTWAKAIVAVGIVPAIAFWLLWIVTNTMSTIQQQHIDILTETRGVLTDVREHRSETIRMIQLLELICRRMGTNTAEREACR